MLGAAGGGPDAAQRPRVAIVGGGSAGMRHHEVFQRMGADVVVVPARPARVAKLRASGVRSEPNLSSLEGELEAIVIASDTARHLEDLALAAKLPARSILIEKPVAPTLDHARALSDVVRAVEARTFVGCCLRMDAGLRAFRAALPAVGRLHDVSIECRSYLPDWQPQRDHRQSYSARADEGGVLRDLIHEIDYAMRLLGMPTRLWGELAPGDTIGIASEAAAKLVWEAPGGAKVAVALDYLTRTAVRRAIARGELGEVAWDALARTVTTTIVGSPRVEVPVGGSREDMYATQAAALLDAQHPCRDEMATLREGLDALAICDAARLSSASGRREEVRRWS